MKTGKVKQDLHSSLIEVFEKRQFGDYESQAHTDQETAIEVLTKAKVFVEQIKKVLKEPNQ